MTQKSRPQLDQVLGGWTNSDDDTAPDLNSYIAEAVVDDGTFVQSGDLPVGDVYAAQLSSLTDPVSSSSHDLKFRAYKLESDTRVDLLVELRQGYVDEDDQGTLIRAVPLTDIPDAVDQTDTTLSGGEANSITDYQNLSLRFAATQNPPPDDDDLLLRLEGDQITDLEDGDPVPLWPDASTNANDAVQADSDFQPLYKVSVNNGLPGVRFDGSDDWMALTDNIPAGPLSVFIVAQVAADVGTARNGLLINTEGLWAETANTGDVPPHWDLLVGAYADFIEAGTDILDADYHVLGIVGRDFDDIDLTTDGSTVTRTNGTAWNAEVASYVGGFPGFEGAAPEIYHHGDIQAIIATTAVDAPTVAEWLAYLTEKYTTTPSPNRAIVSWAQFEVPNFTPPGGGSSHTFPGYRVAVTAINDDDEVVDEVPYVAGTLQFTDTVDEEGAFAFECSPDAVSRSDLSPGTREVKIYREGVLVHAGDLLGGTYTERGTVRFTGKGYERRLYRRLIVPPTQKLDFENVDLIETMWALIDHANDISDTGITRHPSSTPLGVLRTHHYRWWEWERVGEVQDRFVDAPKGFDYEVDEQKRWKAYHHRIGVTLDPDTYSFEYGKNIIGDGAFSYELDAEETTTRLWVIGFGDGSETHYSSYSDAADIAQYGMLEDTYTRGYRGWVRYLSGVARRKYEKVYRDVRATPAFTATTEDPPFGTFRKGDQVQVTADRGWLQVDGLHRIMAITTRQAKSGAELSTMVFNPKLIDIPETDPDE